MKKEYEAYYSRAYAWIFIFLILLSICGIIIFSIFWQPDLSLRFIIILSVACLLLAVCFFGTIRKDGVAVQVIDNQLILYKKEFIRIPIEDIITISIHDGDGSFDISLKTHTKRYSMHCFIKEQRKKKDEFISLLKSKGIKVITFDSSGID